MWVTHLRGFAAQQMMELSLCSMSRPPPTSVCGVVFFVSWPSALQRSHAESQEAFQEHPPKMFFIIIH